MARRAASGFAQIYARYTRSIACACVVAFRAIEYFKYRRLRPDRRRFLDAWIEEAIRRPIPQSVQADGRIRRWITVDSARRFLRRGLLPDGRTVHNAFFDQRFPP